MNKMNVYYGISSLYEILKEYNPSKTLFVIPKRLKDSGLGAEDSVFVDDGEILKTWDSVQRILSIFAERKLDKDSVVVAVGGGSVGDAIGFACSIYLRGISYINVPTTLLAQVDSAHGGKTAINFEKWKNQIGTIYPAYATVIETSFLKTLPIDQLVSGLGEIIKAGFIGDKSILKILKKCGMTNLVQDKNLKKVIERSIKVKLKLVSKDLSDKGVRQFLNVGHTIGHALELDHDLSHGLAVIYGMVAEFKMSERAGISHGISKELTEVLKALGISTDKNLKLNWDGVSRDKRLHGQTLNWPIITKPGKAKTAKISIDKFKKLYESVNI